MIFKSKTFWLLILFFSFSEIRAQVCTGSLGDPVLDAGTDFGRGTATYGPSLGSKTTYTYVAGTPNDGQYTLVKSTAGQNSGWHQNVVNHTPNDPNGYMLLVNANYNQDIFFQGTVNNLCPNTTYEFAAWIINILRGTGIKPNIKFTIENNGSPIKEFSTNNIPEGTATDWKKYGTTFTTPANIGTITLKMTNINPGGSGNDLAIDDITFRACGPVITPTFNNASTTADVCEGITNSYNLSVQVSPGYSDPVFQWQKYNGTIWLDLPGENATQLNVNLINVNAGAYQYRLNVAERQNINSINCRISSPPLIINVNAKPNPVASGQNLVCAGNTIQLNVSEGVSFSWTGPNFTSTLQNPTISNATAANSGTYTVTVKNASGCTNTSQTSVQVLPLVMASTNFSSTTLCEGEKIGLQASGGSSYTWSPVKGLSNPNIANPIASPTENTIYSVKISNGACEETKTVNIAVTKKAKVSAGEDKKIIKGQSTTLAGSAIGENLSYSWSPATYLDDPTKLNPKASPVEDITYTLTVISTCGAVTDDVFVKVYPKIEIQTAFTPNGDNINDTWSIPAMGSFASPKLKIVNRLGQLVFEANTTQPWDGKWNGKDLPNGVYYYTLHLDETYKTYSGWILLTR